MFIVVDNTSHIVHLAGTVDVTSGMSNWCSKYVISNYTVISGVTLPVGYIDNCWTYISGVWTIVAGKEVLVDTVIGASQSIPVLLSSDITSSSDDPTTSLDVVIHPVANATSYELRYKTNGNYTSITVLAAGTVKITGLAPGTTYYISLRVHDLSGISNWSNDVSHDTEPLGMSPPAVVTDLSLGEDWTNTDGLYIPTLGLVYTPPNDPSWVRALIQISTDGGLTYKDYGYDQFSGTGFLIVGTGFFSVNDYVTVRVISENKYGVQSPAGISPTIMKHVDSQVIAPPVPTGLRIEGAASPTTYTWNGLKFSIVWNASAQGTQSELQGAGGVPYDPHWAFDELSLIINGVEEYTSRVYTFRYDYIYGDGIDTFLDAKLLATQGTITIRVRRWNVYNIASDWNSITITNSPPQAPANLTGYPWMYAAQFKWDANAEPDFDHYVYRCKVASGTWDPWKTTVNNSMYRAITDAERTAYGDGAAIYIEVQTVDIFGNVSSTSSTDINADSLNFEATAPADFSVTATKMFTKTIILSGDVWSDNSPSAGYVAWNAHQVVYNGAAYNISAGNTNLTYIYWTGGTSYQTSNTNPTLTDGQFVIATNVSGAHDLAWNAMANAVVGTAHIQNLAVKDAHIDTLSVSKLTAGTLTSRAITMAVAAGQGDTVIKAGKADFGDNSPGFIIGMDDSDSDKVKFEIGNATDYLKFDGSVFTIGGSLAIAGPPGSSLYTWIKYADTPTTGMSDDPTGKSYLGLAYNKTSPTKSTNYSDYTWSLTVGVGVPGPQSYTWVKYADDSSGTGLSDSPVGKTYIGLAFNKTTATESTTPSDYSWSLIKGTDGSPGAAGPGLSYGTTPPGSPVNQQLWYNSSTTDGTYYAKSLYQYVTGTGWVLVSLRGTYIDANGLYTGTVVADNITSGSIRGINVQAASHTTKGSYLTSATSANDATIYIHNTTDFPSSGSGTILDVMVVGPPGGDFLITDTFSWTGKTATTLTGCTGVSSHASGVLVIPDGKCVVIDANANEICVWGDRGDGTTELLVDIGTAMSPPGINMIAIFGSPNNVSGTQIIAVRGITNNGVGVQGEESGGGTALYGFSQGDGGQALLALAQGMHTTAVHGIANGSGHFGIGAEFQGTMTPLILNGWTDSFYTDPPTHLAPFGSIWVTSAGVVYINTSQSYNATLSGYTKAGTTWQKIGAQ